MFSMEKSIFSRVMDRDALDLNAVSRSFVKNSVIISHAGVDQSFSVYQHAITSHFLRTPIVWKMSNGKTFPHRLTFPLKFVPYEEKFVFGPQISPIESSKIAFLHFFNINVTSADDYRTNVRHNVSDWFAKLNSKPDVQWMILVNTTRAKDRKTKSAIMEKIKTDFSKFPSRLAELHDPSDSQLFANFVQNVQQMLIVHFSLITEIWDKSLKNAHEKRKNHGWEPFSYFSSMTEYSRMFWSFGALEYVVSVLDDLEQLLIDFIRNPDAPKWLSQMLNLKIEDRPSILSSLQKQRLEKKEAHLMGMMNWLLSRQIVLSVHLYQHKMKGNEAAPSLRSDCAVGIMSRALVTIETVKEFNAFMNNKRDVSRTCCWTWWTVDEALSICQLLCDVSHLSPTISSRLQLAKFDALHQLARSMRLNPEDVVDLGQWLSIQHSQESAMLKMMVESTEKVCSELERAHDQCVTALQTANRHRFVMSVTHKLFGFLRNVNAKCPKMSITRQMLETLPSQPTTAHMLKTVCSELIESEGSSDELLTLLLFIIQCSKLPDTDPDITELFLKKCENRKESVDLRTLCSEELFDVLIENFEPVQTTDSTLKIRVSIFSKLNFSLKNAEIHLEFAGSHGSQIAHSADLSVLSLQHEKKENVCRLVSELKLKGAAQPEEHNSSLSLKITSEPTNLEPGENFITFETDISNIGCFILEKVSMATPLLSYSTTNVSTRRPAALYCIPTPHSVTVVNDSNHHLFAGVMQDVEVEVQAMCSIPRETHLEIDSAHNFQFLANNSWSNSLTLNLEPFESGEKRKIHVKLWLKIDATICESAAVQKRTLLITWMNRRYNLSLNFVPVMVITSKTSMLTTDILLEVEINRAAGSNISIIINSASLLAEQQDVSSEAEPLTNFPLECAMLSVINLLWKLPIKGSLVKHNLHIEYKVKNELAELTFDDIVEITVPNVQFEFCCQVLSQQPGAQLCRAGSACHFVISIRCLRELGCTLLVVLDADERMWTLVERTKIVSVKDSGLGQLALPIIPVVAGYLPFPNVSIYECQLVSESIIPGNEILCFNRTAGKQIRVLSPSNNLEHFHKDDSMRSSNRIAQKIGKLFD